MGSLNKNKIWTFVDSLQGRKIISPREIFKTKYDDKEKIQKYKVRLIVKGYSKNIA